mgnify:CR=1 FL=1
MYETLSSYIYDVKKVIVPKNKNAIKCRYFFAYIINDTKKLEKFEYNFLWSP